MPHSMTGFAALAGHEQGWDWGFEIRSVNGRGLDLRLRLPDGIDGLEPGLRRAVTGALGRGNVTVNLRIARSQAGAEGGPSPEALDRVLTLLRGVEARAAAQGLALAPSRATDILAMRELREAQAEGASDPAPLAEPLLAVFTEQLLPAFQKMRAEEGARLAAILTGQLDEIERLTEAAAARAAARPEAQRAQMQAALERLTGEAAPVDPDRLAQELALLAVRGDVTEEIDRLRAHVAAARDLLAAEGPVGRKLDFLSQEFNREANTLCSKAQDPALTGIGLDLKTTIDQMREQVQNVE